MNERINIASSAVWEDIVGYSWAVRISNFVEVAGTTAVDIDGNVVRPGDAFEQTHFILAKIEWALAEAGAAMTDVIRIRMFVTDIACWPEVARAHSEFFDDIRPTVTAVEVSRLIGDEMLVEIEATAVIGE